jgi:hypothetical protein
VRVGGQVVLGQREVVVRAVGATQAAMRASTGTVSLRTPARKKLERPGLHHRVERRATADRVAAQGGEQVDQRLLAPPVAVVGLQHLEQDVAQGVESGRDQVGAEPALLVDRQRDVAVVLDQHHLVDHRHPSRGRHQRGHGHRLPLRTVVRRGHLGQERASGPSLPPSTRSTAEPGGGVPRFATGPQRPPATGDQVDRLGQPVTSRASPSAGTSSSAEANATRSVDTAGQHVGQGGLLRHHDARRRPRRRRRAPRRRTRRATRTPSGTSTSTVTLGWVPSRSRIRRRRALPTRRGVSRGVHERPRTTRIRGRGSSSAGSRGARVSRP